MPDTSTTIIEQFSWTGALSPAAAITLGAILAIAAGVLLYWELRSGRTRLAVSLWLLRCATLGVILLILAGPSRLTRTQTFHPRTLALFVDTSASMNVHDGADDLDHEPLLLRWLMTDNDPSAAGYRHLDEAAATIGQIRSQLSAQPRRSTGPPTLPADNETNRRRAIAQTSVELLNTAETRMTDAGDLVTPGLRESFRGAAAATRIAIERYPLASVAASREVESLQTVADRLTQVADDDVVRRYRALPAEQRDRLRARADQARRELASRWLASADKDWLSAARSRARVVSYQFDRAVTPLAGAIETKSSDKAALSTDLTAVLTQLTQDAGTNTLTGAIVLTDGGHNAESDPVARAASAAGIPFYIVPIGQTRPVRDVSVHHVQAPRTVLLSDTILIEATLDAQGCIGEELTAELLEGDRVLDERRLAISGETFTQSLSFRRKADRLGTQHFRVRVTPVPGERVADNNEQSVTVEIGEDQIRLLLADNTARWEHRFLRNLLRRDPHARMDELLFEPARGDGSPAAGAGWPADLDAWSQYRVVILGDLGPPRLNAAQQTLLERHVRERGGTIILIAGTQFMPQTLTAGPLAPLLPVTHTERSLTGRAGFALALTGEGLASTVTSLVDDTAETRRLWQEQIDLHELSDYARPRPTAHVWVTASPTDTQSQPAASAAFLCWQPYGRGRVVYLAAPMTHRLRRHVGDTYHHRFWGQLLRWSIARDVMAGSNTVRLSTDKTRYQQEEPAQVELRLSEPTGQAVSGETVRVRAEQDGKPVLDATMREDAMNPGTYRAVLRHLPTGRVSLHLDSPRVTELLASEGRTEPVDATVFVDPPEQLELRNTRCNLPLLRQIARAGGGQVIAPDAVASIVRQLDLTPDESEHVTEQPLWTRWSCLALLATLLTLEWTLRKLAGLA